MDEQGLGEQRAARTKRTEVPQTTLHGEFGWTARIVGHCRVDIYGPRSGGRGIIAAGIDDIAAENLIKDHNESLQKFEKLLAEWAKRERGYRLLGRLEGADLIDECRKDLKRHLSENETSTACSSEFPVNDSNTVYLNPSPVASVERQPEEKEKNLEET